MRITLNGEPAEFPAERLTVTELLRSQKVEAPEMVSVQLNGTIVYSARYDDTVVADRDEVEFLYFMGGGSNRQAGGRKA